jgi:hypothetical protein
LYPTTNVFLPAIDFPIGIFDAGRGWRPRIFSAEIDTNTCTRLQVFFCRLLNFQSVFLKRGGAGGPDFFQRNAAIICTRLQMFFYRLLIFQLVFLKRGGAGGPGFYQ